MSLKINFLKADHGDAFIIEIKNKHNTDSVILIDGGLPDTFRRHIKPIIQNLKTIDLVVLTHTDDDHIRGLVSFFESSLFSRIEVKEYWANCHYSILLKSGNQVSFTSANKFDKALSTKEDDEAKNKWIDQIIFDGSKRTIGEVDFIILSPQQEQIDHFYSQWANEEKTDNTSQVSSIQSNQLQRGTIADLGKKNFNPSEKLIRDYVNASSIAFIIKWHDFSALFLGDARPEIVVDSLRKLGYNENNRLKVNYMKVSHHGSLNNTSPELLSLIDCNHFLISTNGGAGRSKHPDREVIAWILCRKSRGEETTHLYFNYKLSDIEAKAGIFLTEEECTEFNCEIHENVNEIIYEK